MKEYNSTATRAVSCYSTNAANGYGNAGVPRKIKPPVLVGHPVHPFYSTMRPHKIPQHSEKFCINTSSCSGYTTTK